MSEMRKLIRLVESLDDDFGLDIGDVVPPEEYEWTHRVVAVSDYGEDTVYKGNYKDSVQYAKYQAKITMDAMDEGAILVPLPTKSSDGSDLAPGYKVFDPSDETWYRIYVLKRPPLTDEFGKPLDEMRKPMEAVEESWMDTSVADAGRKMVGKVPEVDRVKRLIRHASADIKTLAEVGIENPKNSESIFGAILDRVEQLRNDLKG